MRIFTDYSDERLKSGCVYCHQRPDTVDHIPSKVFLDKPFPMNLITVPACSRCNSLFSLDEEYMASFIEWLKSMQDGTGDIGRKHIKDVLSHSPKLEERFFSSITKDDNGHIVIKPEYNRIREVVRKHAIGIVFYEMGESVFNEFRHISFQPVYSLNAENLITFNTVPEDVIFAEVGSRLQQRQSIEGNGWHIVQEDNFRYLILCQNDVIIRMVFQEFLYSEVIM